MRFGGKRGRLISVPDRSKALELIGSAVASGARKFKACEELGITVRTLQRRTEGGELKADGRPDAKRPIPGNKLTQEERERILAIAQLPAHKNLPPSQIVPALADKGEYLARTMRTFWAPGCVRQAIQTGRLHRGVNAPFPPWRSHR